MDTHPTPNAAHMEEIISCIVDEENIKWEAKTFQPFKAEGSGDLAPIFLLANAWREVKVLFISKTEKFNHSTAKDYRSISGKVIKVTWKGH